VMQLALSKNNQVNAAIFWLYNYFIIDFFLHLSQRIPGYAVIRPTLLLTVALTLFLVTQKDKFTGIGNDPVFKKINLLIIFLLVTLPFVTWPGSVLKENLPEFVKSVSFLFFTAMIVDTEKRLKIFLSVFVSSQIFRALEPLYMNVTSGYWGDRTYLGGGEFAARLSGAPSDVINPNGLGFVIVTIIPYLYYLVWQSRSKFLKLLALVVAPLLVYALVLTMSRGAFLALLVVLWMIFKESRHKFFLIILFCVALVGVWTNLSDNHKDRYLSLVSSDAKQAASAEGRFTGMITEFGVALDRPLIGHGLGTSGEAKANAGVGWMISHNLYLEVLIETGFIGLIIFFLFLKSIYTKFKENLGRIKNYPALSGEDGFALRLNTALTAVFWMYAVYSINYFGLSVYYWYLFAGLTVAFSRIYSTHNDDKTKEVLIDG
jgi:putative inorganic carbon (HCO3(-)) transporter